MTNNEAKGERGINGVQVWILIFHMYILHQIIKLKNPFFFFTWNFLKQVCVVLDLYLMGQTK